MRHKARVTSEISRSCWFEAARIEASTSIAGNSVMMPEYAAALAMPKTSCSHACLSAPFRWLINRPIGRKRFAASIKRKAGWRAAARTVASPFPCEQCWFSTRKPRLHEASKIQKLFHFSAGRDKPDFGFVVPTSGAGFHARSVHLLVVHQVVLDVVGPALGQ